MTFVDRSMDLVRDAVRLVGKKPLARRAGVDHGVLRQVEHGDRFSPHARKLRALERAAREILNERGINSREGDALQRECGSANPGAVA